MHFTETEFPGLFIFEPKVLEDSRGFFFESFNERIFSQQGLKTSFVQDNHSRSKYGVIRGLHFQSPPDAQTKLVRVLVGSVLDVVVDLRIGSPTYPKVYALELSAENKKQLYIPKGFAHGFSVLTNTAEILYKCDKFYNKESEVGILYNDPLLDIDWKIPEGQICVSEKDLRNISFAEYKSKFVFEGK